MHNNDYFTNLNDYLTDMVNKDKLSYKNLEYLYNKKAQVTVFDERTLEE